MNSIANQFRRIFSDDGRGDKDFTGQEERLRKAQQHLTEAAEGLTKAANILADLLKLRA
jgi:hypothetical protein